MPATDAVQAKLLELRLAYARQLPEKLACIDAAFAAFVAAPWEEQACSTAYRLFHSLAGSSGTYGFDEIGRLARQAEAFLKASLEGRVPLLPEQRQEVLRLSARLAELAASPL